MNYNLSKEANEFNVYRKITVTNARTGTIMLQAEGYMSLSNNSDNELVVTIRTGEDEYYKNYIYLNDWTCYVMEQTEPKGTDKYHYELVFYPERDWFRKSRLNSKAPPGASGSIAQKVRAAAS